MEMFSNTESVMVRVNSHRAADKLKRLVGADLNWHWNFYEGNNFALIPLSLLDEARKIAGVTKARPKHELRKCMAW